MHTAMQQVLDLQEFTPNVRVNSVMSNLVETVITHENIHTTGISEADIQRIRDISAKTETEMEKYWARRIIATPSELALFPYIKNYTELTKRELALVEKTGLTLTNTHRALIIGSGPLPLTAYELFQQTGVIVDQIDISSEAKTIGSALSVALGLEGEWFVGDGATIDTNRRYDFVLIAALAGQTVKEKQEILDNVARQLTPHGRIVLRSATGSRELLYPAVKAAAFERVVLREEYHPSDYIINSVFVYSR